MKKKNLILGAITNYGWGEIAPFFNSYKLAGFENCDCVIFADNITKDAAKKLQAIGVKILPIPEQYMGGCINNYRFELFSKFLNDNADKYNFVFVADVRDVIFQRDLFGPYDPERNLLMIAIEDGILTEKYNQKWLIDRYGTETYETIKNERIICCGTVWGSSQIFREFLARMAEEIMIKNYPGFCDQAAENYLIYYKKLFSDVLVKSESIDGPVMTIGLTDSEKIKLDANNNILNGAGNVAAVVHQYDRKDFLRQMAVRKYSQGMSIFEKLSLIHPSNKDFRDFSGRLSRFIIKVQRKGFRDTFMKAIRKRLRP